MKNQTIMKTAFFLLGAGLILSGESVCLGALIVADNFNRTDSSSMDTTSTGGFTWNEQETASTGLRISGNRLTAGSTTSGREYATVNLSSASGYSTTLANNAGIVTWTINMRNTRSDPSGFDSNNYGMGFILAANSAASLNAQGYAVVLGQDLTSDPIRLVSFNNLNGNSGITTFISSGDYGSEYLNIKVTYDPSGNNWSLYGTSHASSFSDPTSVTTQLGATTVNSTYTGSALDYAGILWNHNTAAGDSAIFDNFSVSAVPEPTTWALGIFGAFGGLVGIGTVVGRRLQSAAAE